MAMSESDVSAETVAIIDDEMTPIDIADALWRDD
jgi:hypothetical protein